MSSLGHCGLVSPQPPPLGQPARVYLIYVVLCLSDMDLTVETFPPEGEVDPKAYLGAIDSFKAGDAVTIFTPGKQLDIMDR